MNDPLRDHLPIGVTASRPRKLTPLITVLLRRMLRRGAFCLSSPPTPALHGERNVNMPGRMDYCYGYMRAFARCFAISVCKALPSDALFTIGLHFSHKNIFPLLF